MADIQAATVPPANLAVWFLGQNGWIVKSPGGRVLAVDPYLTDSCHPSRRGLDLRRRVPVAIAPGELAADVVLCTHAHKDHADPEGLPAMAESGRVAAFAGPPATQAVFAAAGIAEDRRRLAWPGDAFQVGDLTLAGTFALPTDTTDLTHMGVVVSAPGSPRFWIVGDTAWCDLLADSGRVHAPDVVAVPINGGYANLSHWQAAELVKRVGARQAFPCHWDMFADNACDPRMFAASLTVLGIGDAYRAAEHGKMVVLG
ncbi:MBL fold metallo-hydrolase [Magnetospirillum sp. UT-4]|uniref:MBL fold metallo-hydrolase n=1 Tax=Magnetospirillum sp. UT-4 TaxID=2681467 RepID=UPI0020C50DF4|nr:MBL fold metallo-hydrolase [Magnetospirillum sp. UT-4]